THLADLGTGLVWILIYRRSFRQQEKLVERLDLRRAAFGRRRRRRRRTGGRRRGGRGQQLGVECSHLVELRVGFGRASWLRRQQIRQRQVGLGVFRTESDCSADLIFRLGGLAFLSEHLAQIEMVVVA